MENSQFVRALFVQTFCLVCAVCVLFGVFDVMSRFFFVGSLSFIGEEDHLRIMMMSYIIINYIRIITLQ